MITNPDARRILCFGDSLTWGYIPGTPHERYAPNVRWTGVLQEELGGGYEVIEEGLNSRGIDVGDQRDGKEGRRAMDYIEPCLDTHDPLDLVVVMLGTNELKNEAMLTPEQISESMRHLLSVITQRKSQYRDIKPKTILMAPPIINESTIYCRKGDKYKGAHSKSKQLAQEYSSLARQMNIPFLDLSQIVEVGADGVHIDDKSHELVGSALAEVVLSADL